MQPVRTPTVIRGGSEVERALRERIEELEEEVRQLRAYRFGDEGEAPLPDGVSLTRQHTAMWGLLWHRRGKLVSYEAFMDCAGAYEGADVASIESVRVQIHHIRRKLHPHGALIENDRGRGYRLILWPSDWERAHER